MAQTALQELILELKKQNQDYYEKWKASKGDNKKMWNDAMSVQTICIIKAQSLLPKERQQIIDAIDYAATCDATHGYIPTGEDYFNQTFNQK